MAELSAFRRNFLEDLAESIWRGHNSYIPTPLEVIIEHEGILFDADDYGDSFDGLLEYRDGVFMIFSNTSLSRTSFGRHRFTLAHELGHYFIDEHRLALMSGRAPSHAYNADRASEVRVEREADCFASALLMPRIAFATAVDCRPLGIGSIRELASTFGVSLQSAARRYAQCSSRPVALFFIPDTQAKRPWCEPSIDFRKAGFGAIPASFHVIPESATDCARASGLVEQGTTTATCWFTNCRESTVRNIVLHEESFRVGSYGCLVVLTPLRPGDLQPLMQAIDSV